MSGIYEGHQTVTWEELIATKMTKGQLPKKFGFDHVTTDTAVPQGWLNAFVKHHELDYDQVIFSTFYMYADGDTWGRPISCCTEIQECINKDGVL